MMVHLYARPAGGKSPVIELADGEQLTEQVKALARSLRRKHSAPFCTVYAGPALANRLLWETQGDVHAAGEP